MQPMFENYVLPKLRASSPGILVARRILKVSGIGESAVDEQIAPIYVTYPSVQTSILFNKSEVEVHLAAKSRDQAEAVKMLDELSEKVVSKLGVAVFSLCGESMEEVVGKLLSSRKETLAVAESCTGGLVGTRLTEVPGSSAYFVEGVVAYSNEAKMRTLAVPEATLVQFGAVSAETAEAMAVGMRDRAGSDHAISVTGIAGPDGGSDEKPVGLVYIGYADKDRVKSFKIVLPGDRYLVRWRSSQAALDYLRRQLLKGRETASAGN
jgi:nicotinamide-nucleotide amidase